MTSAGWVSIPNTGKLPVDGEEYIDTRSGDADPGLGSESTMARDLRAHAAKNVSFELESSLPRIRPRRGPRPSPNWGAVRSEFGLPAGTQGWV